MLGRFPAASLKRRPVGTDPAANLKSPKWISQKKRSRSVSFADNKDRKRDASSLDLG
ncbi:hypothetical protein Pla52o_42280 [Novipirellula galeiformis]|uniref:Uncharacterized protein n=1 Tax=Novipirellula galeiformis TaxID=2528004 RepID=A0A5C6CCM1_9BACT|nr:hypothetical protein Pla52o_42280 [Novipirellula galeiformis]